MIIWECPLQRKQQKLKQGAKSCCGSGHTLIVLGKKIWFTAKKTAKAEISNG